MRIVHFPTAATPDYRVKHERDELEPKIEEASAELARLTKQDEGCHRSMEVLGFGPTISMALVRPLATDQL